MLIWGKYENQINVCREGKFDYINSKYVLNALKRITSTVWMVFQGRAKRLFQLIDTLIFFLITGQEINLTLHWLHLRVHKVNRYYDKYEPVMNNNADNNVVFYQMILNERLEIFQWICGLKQRLI